MNSENTHSDGLSGEYVAGYVPLFCKSNFSFLEGASHPEELVEQAHALGYRALALTDEASLAGVVRAHTEARVCGLAVVHEGRCSPDSRAVRELVLGRIARRRRIEVHRRPAQAVTCGPIESTTRPSPDGRVSYIVVAEMV